MKRDNAQQLRAELVRARSHVRVLLRILDRIRLGVSLWAYETDEIDRAREFLSEPHSTP